MEKCAHRWLVDISEWNPSHEDFSLILSTLPLHEHSSITRFIHFKDKKRALVSRLLQYALAHQITQIPFHEISIKRTIEGKPYVEFANFNFNTSHDGDYVGIVSEPFYIVGVDIVSLIVPKQETAVEFVKSFAAHFTSVEWEDITGAEDILEQFCKYWCLKEAFVKAIGAGLGYRLNRVEFKHQDWRNISVHIDGEESTDWEFSLCELGKKNHWVCIARGHPRNAVENYRRTLGVTDLEEEGNVSWTTSFVLRKVEELLPAFIQ